MKSLGRHVESVPSWKKNTACQNSIRKRMFLLVCPGAMANWRSRGSLGLTICFLLWTCPPCAGDVTRMRECFIDNPTVSSGGQASITLTCPADHTIRVEDALFGRSRWRICDLAEGDCIDRTEFFHSCDGLNNCTVAFKIFSTKCGDSTTLMLSFSCIREYTQSIAPTETYETRPSSTEQTTLTRTRVSQGNQGTASSWPRYPAPREDGGDDEDIGVVIGCAIAAVITIIMLIIAIIVVIRALLQYYKKGQDGERPGRVVSCMDSVCLRVDKLPCFSSRDREPDSQSLRGGKELTSLQAQDSTSGGSAPGAKLPIDRIAPVGQECSSSSSSSGSRTSVDSGLSEMQNSSNHNSPQLPQPPLLPQAADAGRQGVPEALVDPRDVLANNAMRPSSKNSSPGSKNFPDKVSSWREKEMARAKVNQRKDNNQNISGAPRADPKGPKFDAVAIPNTETATAC